VGAIYPAAFRPQPLRARGEWDVYLQIEVHMRDKVLRATYNTTNKLKGQRMQALAVLITELLRDGIIEKARPNCPHRNPVHLVAKPNGDLRLTLDCRSVNKLLVNQTAPILNVHDMVRRHSCKRYVSSMDFKRAFFQLMLETRSRDWTTFSTPMGVFRFRAMPQGLVCSPSYWQYFMYHLFGTLIRKGHVDAYMDDIIISSNSLAEHKAVVHEVMGIITKNGLYLDADKSRFFQSSLKYLGFTISVNGASILDTRARELIDRPLPTTTKEMRSWIGAIQFVNGHVHHCALLIHELTQAVVTAGGTKQHPKPIAWTRDLTATAEELKRRIGASITLVPPNQEEPFLLYCDAAPAYGYGAALLQKRGGHNHVVAMFSRALTEPQKGYTPNELELFAVKDALAVFHDLTGPTAKVTVYTDNKSITHLDTLPATTYHIMRWRQAIQHRNIELVWIAGLDNPLADYLSRFPRVVDTRLITSGDKRTSNPTAVSEAAMTECMTIFPRRSAPAQAAPSAGLPITATTSERGPASRTRNARAAVENGHTIAYARDLGSRGRRVQESPSPTPPSPVSAPADNGPARHTRRARAPAIPASNHIAPEAAARAMLDESFFDPPAVRGATEYRNEQMRVIARFLTFAQAQHPTELAKLRASTVSDELVIRDGVVYVKPPPSTRTGRARPWVPPNPLLRQRLLELAHVQATGHRAARPMIAFLKESFFWPDLGTDVHSFCGRCLTCARTKHDHRTRTPIDVVANEPPLRRPYDVIGMDLFYVPSPDPSRYNMVLVTICYLTKHVIYTPCHTTATHKDILDLLDKHVFAYFGYPRAIMADRDARWAGTAFEGALRTHDTALRMSVAHRHRTNGMVERQIGTLGNQLAARRSELPRLPWQHHLPWLMQAHNSVIHSSTNCSPNDLIFTFRPTSLMDAAFPAAAFIMDDDADTPSFTRVTMENFITAMDHLALHRARYFAGYNRGKKERNYAINQLVTITNPAYPMNKSLPRRLGPFRITGPGEMGSNTWRLALPGRQTPGRETFPVFHGDAMCKFLGPSPEVGPGDMYFSYRPNPLQGPGVPQPMRRAQTLTS